MLGFQTKQTNQEQMVGSYRRLNSSEGRTNVPGNTSQCCCGCCCCKTRKRSRHLVLRRSMWAERFISCRLTFMTMSLLMLGGALYLDSLITAAPDILMDDPFSPDTEVLLVNVEELTFRQTYLDLKVPVSTSLAAAGYLERTVKYEICDDYDDICKTLGLDGKIFFFTCILGFGLTLPPFLLANRCTGKAVLQCLTFLPAMVMGFALAVWWLDAYLKLSNLKTVSFPFNLSNTNETTMIDMTFEDKRMFPSYSLCLMTLSGLALGLNFIFIMFP